MNDLTIFNVFKAIFNLIKISIGFISSIIREIIARNLILIIIMCGFGYLYFTYALSISIYWNQDKEFINDVLSYFEAIKREIAKVEQKVERIEKSIKALSQKPGQLVTYMKKQFKPKQPNLQPIFTYDIQYLNKGFGIPLNRIKAHYDYSTISPNDTILTSTKRFIEFFMTKCKEKNNKSLELKNTKEIVNYLDKVDESVTYTLDDCEISLKVYNQAINDQLNEDIESQSFNQDQIDDLRQRVKSEFLRHRNENYFRLTFDHFDDVNVELNNYYRIKSEEKDLWFNKSSVTEAILRGKKDFVESQLEENNQNYFRYIVSWFYYDNKNESDELRKLPMQLMDNLKKYFDDKISKEEFDKLMFKHYYKTQMLYWGSFKNEINDFCKSNGITKLNEKDVDDFFKSR